MRRILPSILAYAVVSLVFIHCILRSRLWRREDNDVDAFDGLSIFVSSPSVVARGITPLISSHTVWTRHQQPLGMGTPRSVGRSEARNKALGCERVRKYRYHCVACMHACHCSVPVTLHKTFSRVQTIEEYIVFLRFLMFVLL